MGLAPGAHGSNRTGRPFTGDASGNFMYPVLYAHAFASQPTATGPQRRHEVEGSLYYGCRPLRSAGQQAAAGGARRVLDFLDRELAGLRDVKVVVALGKIGFDAYLNYLKRQGPARQEESLCLQTWRQLRDARR